MSTSRCGSSSATRSSTVVTFILVFIVVSVATDDRVSAAAAGPAIGAALTIGVFIAGPITSGAVNPARAIGPMLVANKFDDFRVYIVGPVIGGTVAALVYDKFIAHAETPE
ncbi:MAG: aquaporin [Ilumatobacteraceae bacterium]